MRRLLTFLLASLLVAGPALADISFVGSAVGENVGSTDVSVTLPGSMAVNDLILFSFCIGDADNVNLDLTMVTAGYTEAGDLFGDGIQEANLGVFYKYHNGSDTTAVGEGSTGGTDTAIPAIVMVFRGVALSGDGGPFDTTSTGAVGGSGNADPASIDWSTAGTWVVITGCHGGGTIDDAATYTFPSGYTTDAVSAAEIDTTDALIGMGYNSAPSDPEDPGVMTPPTGTGWAAGTAALKPAPAVTCTAGLNLTLLGVGGCP